MNVATSFYNSDENRNAQVGFYYRNFLGRTADDSGLTYWRKQLQSGLDESVAMQGFLLSNEYSGKNDNAAFVNTLYYAILGRQAETNCYNYWLGQLNSGTSRATAAAPFIRLQEAIDAVISSFWLSFLKRSPANSDLIAERQLVQSGATFGSIAMGLLGSQEFFDKAGK